MAEFLIGKAADGKFVCESRQIREYKDEDKYELQVLNIYPEVTDQTVLGFGGALTDASCSVLEQMPKKQQEEILQAYFGPEGIGYNTVRVHLDSCDFSVRMYAAAKDWKAGSADNVFRFTKEQKRINKYLKRIGEILGKPVPILLCPWSPLASMKDNKSRIGGRLLKERYRDWADYVCHYILEMQKLGFVIYAVTPQNEPNAWQIWDSSLYSAADEAEYIETALAPAFKQYGLEEIRICIWDHNKERVVERAGSILKSGAGPDVSGIAFHWYSGDHFDAVRIIHNLYPEKLLVFSEGCVGFGDKKAKTALADAEKYAHDMIGDLRGGLNIFYDWNIVLDMQGGPNHVENYCDAPILCDPENKTYERHLSFEYIGMISRAVEPGAVRVETSVYTEEIENAAFINPDGAIVLVLLNRSSRSRKIQCRAAGKRIPLQLPGHAIAVLTI